MYIFKEIIPRHLVLSKNFNEIFINVYCCLMSPRVVKTVVVKKCVSHLLLCIIIIGVVYYRY